MFGPKLTTWQKREEMAKKLFDGCYNEFTEQSLPGNVVNYFQEMLAGLPNLALDKFDLEAMFLAALKNKRGDK